MKIGEVNYPDEIFMEPEVKSENDKKWACGWYDGSNNRPHNKALYGDEEYQAGYDDGITYYNKEHKPWLWEEE